MTDKDVIFDLFFVMQFFFIFIVQKLYITYLIFICFQKIASPTLSVVNEAFMPLLTRLDECIAYVEENVIYFNFKIA